MPAFYRATFSEFREDAPDTILGAISRAYQHNELQKRQIKAWEKEISLLKRTIAELLNAEPISADWSILLEYPIPRRQKRLDAVVLAHDVILCIEFKTEDKIYSLQAQRQVEEYGLDLRDFHEASRDRAIVPLLVVPKAPDTIIQEDSSTDLVLPVCLANGQNLHKTIFTLYQFNHRATASRIDPDQWDDAPYRPIPSIIEAAEALYAGHNVQDIAHSHAGRINITATSDFVVRAIRGAQNRREKVICFITGVPGAGKTLAGLNIVHNPSLRNEGRPAGIFLSGNGPLVKIVSAAIARDHRRRSQDRMASRTVTTFIQNVHVFIRTENENLNPPAEHVVVFDEAQRAWSAEHSDQKNGISISEPETILTILDRHSDWSVLVCLIGGGQEINSGEAGIALWGQTLRDKFQHWKVIVSPKVLGRDPGVAGHHLFDDGDSGALNIVTESSLHLNVNVRSIKVQNLTRWVEAVLSRNPDAAQELMAKLNEYPLKLTRSLSTARQWLRQHTRGQRRCGLLASSGAVRLRADGVELSSGFRQGNRDLYVHWFLASADDIRSSNQLEVAASEFECQGLEVDWAGICWGGDFTFDPVDFGWCYRSLSGSKWGNLKPGIDRSYVLNTYRVLLTRARRGLIIFVPKGDPKDHTRQPEWFDSTASYLKSCGLPEV